MSSKVKDNNDKGREAIPNKFRQKTSQSNPIENEDYFLQQIPLQEERLGPLSKPTVKLNRAEKAVLRDISFALNKNSGISLELLESFINRLTVNATIEFPPEHAGAFVSTIYISALPLDRKKEYLRLFAEYGPDDSAYLASHYITHLLGGSLPSF